MVPLIELLMPGRVEWLHERGLGHPRVVARGGARRRRLDAADPGARGGAGRPVRRVCRHRRPPARTGASRCRRT